MKNDKCNACSGFPTGGVPCEPNKFTQAVVEINNPKECPILFHKVVIPVTMGDETSVPPEIGKYSNVLLVYEINNHSYLYSSDGVPTRLNNGITNYEEATNLPQINGVTLRGNKSAADLNLADAPMVITVADGNTSWSGADTAEDVYNFFLNKGKVNIIFNGGENYAYEIASAGYIPEEEKMMCTLAVATITTVENTAEFEGNALFGTMTLYTADKAIDVSQIELQPKLFVTDFTGLDLNYNELSGVPATTYSIGMVKPGAGLSVDSDGTMSASIPEDAVAGFDTVADMKANEDLVDGSIAQTLGFYAKGDYGAATYSISDDSLTANGSTIIALDNGLFAVLNLNERVIKAEQFGAYGDGTHDDTAAVQSAIDYSIANECVLEFNGDYLVEPTLRDDNTMVCLNYTKRNTGMQYVGAQMRFNRSARIKTDYADDCTLLRIEARNIIISNGYFSGVQGKTDLIEFSRTNKLSTNYDGWNMDNIIENCIFRYGRNAIAMEGNCYYNRFTNCRIYSCYNGILMQMTALEKLGQSAESNVNRNDFVNVSMNSISNWGIRIEYGATNKFVNLDLEGCTNGIYIDGPIQHTQDFPITPLWNSECNEFVNTMMESITTLQWYNNAPGLRVYGTTSDWGAKAQMVMEPQTFLGGLDQNQSVEKVCASILTKDHGEYAQTGMNPWTAYNRYQTATRYLYDYDESGGVVSNMSLQNVTFDTTPTDANIASITYDAAGVKIKRIGGICFMFGTIKVVPNDITKAIKLYFPSEWMKPLKSMYGQYTLFPPLTNGVYLKAGSTFTNMMAIPVENSLNLGNYSGNWDASNNILTLSLMWLAKGAVV